MKTNVCFSFIETPKPRVRNPDYDQNASTVCDTNPGLSPIDISTRRDLVLIVFACSAFEQ